MKMKIILFSRKFKKWEIYTFKENHLSTNNRLLNIQLNFLRKKSINNFKATRCLKIILKLLTLIIKLPLVRPLVQIMKNWKSLIKVAKVEIYSKKKMYPLGCSWIFNLFWLVVTNLVGTNLAGTSFGRC